MRLWVTARSCEEQVSGARYRSIVAQDGCIRVAVRHQASRLQIWLADARPVAELAESPEAGGSAERVCWLCERAAQDVTESDRATSNRIGKVGGRGRSIGCFAAQTFDFAGRRAMRGLQNAKRRWTESARATGSVC